MVGPTNIIHIPASVLFARGGSPKPATTLTWWEELLPSHRCLESWHINNSGSLSQLVWSGKGASPGAHQLAHLPSSEFQVFLVEVGVMMTRALRL